MISENCLQQDKLLNAVLDGALPASALETEHLEACSRCLAFALFAPKLVLPAIVPPAAVPVWAKSVDSASRPKSRPRLHAAVGVVAASVLLLIGKIGTKDASPNRPEVAEVLPQPKLSEGMNSRTALAQLKQGLNEQVLRPKTTLSLPPILPREVEAAPAGEALAAVPDSARASLEPIAGTTRRAFTMFLRELPSLPREASTNP